MGQPAKLLSHRSQPNCEKAATIRASATCTSAAREYPCAPKVPNMKIATLAVLAASILTLSVPTLAQARMMRHHGSHHMMMRGHHMHMMRGNGGRMAGHRTF